MVVTCPHCHARYTLATTIRNAVLVCSRCGTEFGPDGKATEANDAPKSPEMPSLFDWKPPATAVQAESSAVEEPSPAATIHEEPEVTTDEDNEVPHFIASRHARPIIPQQETPMPGLAAEHEASGAPSAVEPAPVAKPAPSAAAIPEAEPESQAEASDIAPPARRTSRIWPWLLFILLAAAAAGLWFKQDVWLQNIWVRSLLFNLSVPLAPRADDWRIPPASVHSQWLSRDDGSRILVIEGRVENRLDCELAAPAIRVQLYDLPGSTQAAMIRIMPITEPPSLPALKKVPYSPPPADRVPVASKGQRAFVLVLEKLPDGIRDFSLSPAPRQ